MNSNQQSKYGRHFWERTTPIHRVVGCGHCGFTCRLPRAGQNALATISKLRGQVMKHLREKHPEVLDA